MNDTNGFSLIVVAFATPKYRVLGPDLGLLWVSIMLLKDPKPKPTI
jgi:hypothetical protein